MSLLSKRVLTFGRFFCMISLPRGKLMRSFFDRLVRWLRFNLMYLGNPPWDTGITPPELIQFIRDHPPGRAIDLGCGTGTNLIALGKAGWQVTGVDFVARATAAARRRLARAGIQGEVRTGDVTRLAATHGSYQLVLDIGCYHGLPPLGRAAYRANIAEILLTGGWFLLYVHWAKNSQPVGIGITQADLDGFLQLLELEQRQDSQDRWGRQAAWLRFRKRSA
jgi:SAM-dependent methyltransferase